MAHSARGAATLRAVIRLIRRSLALALVATGVLAQAFCSVGQASPSLPLGHAGRWITDAGGRVVVLHGINMVYKLPPYYPSVVGFGNDDAALLARIGFNAVRVGVIWKAVEPSPGVYDNSYLNHIAATVSTLARHGIVSLLDFHQDMYNEEFQGEGAPDWAVQDGGLPNPKLGFPGNYLANLALEHALDQFFSNAPGPGGVGLGQRYAAAWAHVAARFRNTKSVLGYELLNEPFPGTAWEQCASPAGCPVFDGELLALYKRVDAAIRAVSRRTLIWYEPNVLFNDGAGTALGPLGDPRAGFAFHDYCLTQPTSGTSTACTAADNLVFTHALARVASTGDALMMTEFGATTNTAYLTQMVQRADTDMVPWLEWAYCGCSDPTTSGPGDEQAIVRNPALPPSGSNLVEPTLHALVEPYPQVVAGTPLSWGFTAASKLFTVRFTTSRANGHGSFPAGAITQIAVPALVYGGRYSVQANGGRVVSKRGASVLTIASCKRAKTISVTVASSGRNHNSCSAPRRRVKKR
jgi:endoglycosylceramidase